MFIDVIPIDLTTRSVTTSVSTLQHILSKLTDYSIELAGKAAIAFVIFFVGRFIITRIRSLSSKILFRKKLDETVRTFLDSLLNISLKILLAIIIIGQLGIQTASFAAIIAAAGLAIGMAMKDNLSNFAGGVMILFNRPFKVKERILAQGQDGVVQSIGILYTVLLTPDNRTVFIPNGPLSTGTIVNYSTQDTRRIDITFTLGNGIDLFKMKDVVKEIINKDEKILKSPEAVVELSTLSNGSIGVSARVWVTSENYAITNRSLTENIYSTLVENNLYTPAVTTVQITQ